MASFDLSSCLTTPAASYSMFFPTCSWLGVANATGRENSKRFVIGEMLAAYLIWEYFREDSLSALLAKVLRDELIVNEGI